MTEVWMVCGGAGYIGSHVVRSLQAAGVDAVVLDDLSTGRADRVQAPLIVGDIADSALVADVLRDHSVSGVIHLAADKQVEESVRQPLQYYRRNVSNLIRLLEAMAAATVNKLVFSSSAAVYGMVEGDRIAEDGPTTPINPYGETKLVGEWLIRDQARATGLRYAALRYFNVVGADPVELADIGGTNLVPRVFAALKRGDRPTIFGDDYPTPDGTGVRDYIHVADLADAHVAAIGCLDEPGAGHVFNVGCGRGYSVREVIDMIADVTGRPIVSRVLPRRPGDPANVVADVERITSVLGWRARHDLRSMIESAARADQQNSAVAEIG
ncbi:MAG TPA: UDP-glucose 4-epimerase GalE [Jatrophihabitans sp.]|nr:UDP-glucose 4-epimerase GalE [Jatrophihabitans sp.]